MLPTAAHPLTVAPFSPSQSHKQEMLLSSHLEEFIQWLVKDCSVECKEEQQDQGGFWDGNAMEVSVNKAILVISNQIAGTTGEAGRSRTGRHKRERITP